MGYGLWVGSGLWVGITPRSIQCLSTVQNDMGPISMIRRTFTQTIGNKTCVRSTCSYQSFLCLNMPDLLCLFVFLFGD
jgi:hypothetical protein